MNIDNLTVNTLRFLAVEAVQKANSGHPGMPMGASPAAYALWAKNMKHNPKNFNWADRDRFVLSVGHGSALLYAMLHLFGYGLTIEDIKNFRQLGSNTPGHPEYKHPLGVETTTGPLGQGVANAVGFAIAESYLAAVFNRPGFDIVDHYTYTMSGEGCLMEGVSSEAVSLAGTMGLGKLIYLFDSNNITIEGDIETAFSEDVLKRFEAYGWHTMEVPDGMDVSAVDAAIKEAKKVKDKPSIIKCNTIIGYGAPNKQGKAKCHGEPLGYDEIKLAKQYFGWEYEEEFYVPDEVKENMNKIIKEGQEAEEKWNKLFAEYEKAYPELAEKWRLWHSKELPADLLNNEEFWKFEGNTIAARTASETIINRLSKLVPNIIGGSADLGPSNKSVMHDREYYSKKNRGGANIHFGIREFAMSAIASSLYAHGGLRPYTAGFFAFSDYMKSALRLQALMGLPVISVFTHDSIGTGEDGPTHQPIEQLAVLRSIPNYTVFRPADAHETAAGWYAGLTRLNSPTALVLSKQDLPVFKETGKGALKGAYILKDSGKTPDIILIASGSEVGLIYDAYDILAEKGIAARVVSMPSWEIFEEQTDEYKESVFPKSVKNRLAVEASTSFGWHKYIGFDGASISIDRFGRAGKPEEVFKFFGYTVENVVEKAIELIKKNK
ncbi:MAG: transketolase [Lachnospiraceae bacterium]|nr:transketolase [Lachnospiraceae bacterium]